MFISIFNQKKVETKNETVFNKFLVTLAYSRTEMVHVFEFKYTCSLIQWANYIQILFNK